MTTRAVRERGGTDARVDERDDENRYPMRFLAAEMRPWRRQAPADRVGATGR
jgi:hypothetical protein